MSLAGTGYYSLYMQCDPDLCPLEVPAITVYTYRFYGRYTVVRRTRARINTYGLQYKYGILRCTIPTSGDHPVYQFI